MHASCVVHVVVDHELEVALASVISPVPPARQACSRGCPRSSDGWPDWRRPPGCTRRPDCSSGPVGWAVLDEARSWPADLVIIGRAGRWHSGEPYVGAQTRHVLEFAIGAGARRAADLGRRRSDGAEVCRLVPNGMKSRPGTCSL